MRKRLNVAFGVVAIVCGSWNGRAWSQDSISDASAFAAGQPALQASQDDLRKQELVGSILAAREAASGRAFDGDLRAFLAAKLLSASAPALEAFLENGGRGDIDALLRDPAAPKLLGSATTDLVFTPVAPCRIVDTRSAVAGIMVAGTQRNFLVRSAGGFATQGGSASNCGIPTTATAVEMNFVAVSPVGPGNLRAFAFGGTVPNASVINYSPVPGAPFLNVANGIAQPVCNPATTTCTSDLTVQTDAGNTHLVVDVVGYFNEADLAFPAGANASLSGNLTNPENFFFAPTNITPSRTLTCLVNAHLAWFAQGGNPASGFGQIRTARRNVTTATNSNDGNWNNYVGALGTDRGTGSKSWVWTLAPGATYQFGCAVSATNDFVGDLAFCTVSWFCR